MAGYIVNEQEHANLPPIQQFFLLGEDALTEQQEGFVPLQHALLEGLGNLSSPVVVGDDFGSSLPDAVISEEQATQNWGINLNDLYPPLRSLLVENVFPPQVLGLEENDDQPDSELLVKPAAVQAEGNTITGVAGVNEEALRQMLEAGGQGPTLRQLLIGRQAGTEGSLGVCGDPNLLQLLEPPDDLRDKTSALPTLAPISQEHLNLKLVSGFLGGAAAGLASAIAVGVLNPFLALLGALAGTFIADVPFDYKLPLGKKKQKKTP